MIKQLKAIPIIPQYMLAAGGLVAALGLMLNLPPGALPEHYASAPTNRSSACQEIVQPKAALSREQLAQLLTMPERSQRRTVQAIVKQPYCKLPSLSIRAGSVTEREAYPLAFDPQTSLVVLYEGKTYVGYGFKRD